MSQTTHFFEKIPATSAFGDFANRDAYVEAPSNWYVAITDVIESTKAIEEGRYKDVNAIGVACIVGVRNAVKGMEIPFVFGGDGATLLVPGEDVDDVRRALAGLKSLSGEAFSLRLRAGLVPIVDLKAAGHEILVGRHATSEHISQAFLAGDGVKVAERWIKDSTLGSNYEVDEDGSATDVDCSGFECRWEPIASSKGVILSLIVEARGHTMLERNQSYRLVINALNEVIGTTSGASPANRKALRLNKRLSGYSQESRLRTNMRGPWRRGLYSVYCGFENLVGRALLRTGLSASGFGERYLEEVVANTDYRKFDNALRMVIDVESKQLETILSLLDQYRRRDAIFYGTHTATSALMTCAVANRRGQHIHFIDGADGGYALAARQLKTQRSAAITDET